MYSTVAKVMKVLKAHGLYAEHLSGRTIALTDKNGKIYNTIDVTDDGCILDGDTTLSVLAWLGY